MGAPRRIGLWLRWSLRDLRRRWVVVAAIALVIAVGTGTYAGLTSTAQWRRASYDESYEALGMHDLRARLSDGSYADAGVLRAVALDLDDVDVAAAEERLLVPTQVDASTAEETILVRGQLVGLAGDAEIDRVHITDGRGLTPTGTGTTGGSIEAVLETKFAASHELPAQGSLTLPGEREARWVGHGIAPEQFWITPDQGGLLFSAGTYAVLYVPLASAQDVAGRPDQVNDLVVRLSPGADRDAAADALEAALAARLPNVSATVETREDDRVLQMLEEDVDNDQVTFNVIAGLILVGAAIGAFNLVNRLVESQRREIGIGMALGMERGRLAIRPMLVGLEVALAGVAAGLGVGYLVAFAMRSVLVEFLPLPVWQTPFQAGTFARAAALGIVIPFGATAWPVWRAVRVQPIDALKPAHLVARGSRLTMLAGRRSFGQRAWRLLPIRSLLRTPRRTVLTAVGIGAAITALVGVLGMLDTFAQTITAGDAALTRTSPDRLTVVLDGFYPADAPEVTAATDDATVGSADTGLEAGGTLLAGRADAGPGDDIDASIRFLDLDGGLWHPESEDGGTIPSGEGIVLAAKAAEDLGVSPGDMVVLRHPVATDGGYRLTTTELPLLAVHDGPLRFNAYMDVASAGTFGVEGIVNVIDVVPAADSSQDDVQRALFQLPGVASAQPIGATTEMFEEALDEFTGILRIAEVAALALALLIAFNAASITTDERQRDHATMFAFGLPTRSVLAVTIVESGLLGVLGTLIGLAAGYGTVWWMIDALLSESVPDIALAPYLAPGTMAWVLVLGVGAVAAAPVLTARRLRRMDIPSTLRLVE